MPNPSRSLPSGPAKARKPIPAQASRKTTSSSLVLFSTCSGKSLFVSLKQSADIQIPTSHCRRVHVPGQALVGRPASLAILL